METNVENLGYKVHNLKTWPEYFAPIKNRQKRFELRKDDRNIEAGDFLVLQEYDSKSKSYTGKQIIVIVTSKMKDVPAFGLKPGFAIFDIQFHEEMTDEEKQRVQQILNSML